MLATSTVTTAVTSILSSVNSVLTDNLPTILGTFGVLVALGIVLHFVKRFIGRRA